MKKNVQCVLSLLVGIVLLGCENNGHNDLPTGKIYYHSDVHIDSTASACGVDSCVVNLPWLNGEINAFLADSAKRRVSFMSSLRIDRVLCRNLENEDITYFRYEMYGNVKNGSLWFGCEGDTVWIDTTWDDRSQEGKVIKSDKTEDFNEVLDRNGIITDGENIVEIVYGYLPPI